MEITVPVKLESFLACTLPSRAARIASVFECRASQQAIHRDSEFALDHVDIETQLPQAKSWVQVALGLVDDESLVEEVFSDPSAELQSGMLSLF
jgi:hypothetical protein